MNPGAPQDQIEAVVARIESVGSQAFVSHGVLRTIIGIVGDTQRCYELNLPAMPGVSTILRVSAPYKLVSSQAHAERSVIHIGPPGHRIPIGPDTFTLIAGPAAVESAEQAHSAARLAAAAGARVLRGGAYKPRMFPLSFQGMGEDGLKILADVREATGLLILTEAMSPADVTLVASYADMLQIGAANMQNYPLLDSVAGTGKPVLLKRGMQATIEEWLMAAEYLTQRGNPHVVLCERGIRTFETATSSTLDISAIPLVQQLSHLPVIADPSQACGRRDLVVPLARAAIAAGADGLLINVHPDPENAVVDGQHSLAGSELRELASAVRQLPPLLGRRPAEPLS
ncbi:3-deoxy-7-phosphoheptulonate synthase [Actinopolymorpha alba]|uniref:3-deoxy-7-phosphoheptulonate synthase n=1 Tax=Actinopolymorpha alba TaxID=533267 RepID=UPI001ED9971A|nr:3-deoxy-7-phosphoheptulonate synthase [Actinopolymorpha alba]